MIVRIKSILEKYKELRGADAKAVSYTHLLDDPRNQDEIGDKEILVVSFGTSFNDSRVKDIKSIEDSIQDAFPDWAVDVYKRQDLY